MRSSRGVGSWDLGGPASIASERSCLPRSTGAAAAGVSLPSRENMAKVAGTSNARTAAHMGQLQRVPRPASAASGQDRPPLHQMERSSPVRNRMLEIGASGSVGGEGGNILVYPATWPAMPILKEDTAPT